MEAYKNSLKLQNEDEMSEKRKTNNYAEHEAMISEMIKLQFGANLNNATSIFLFLQLLCNAQVNNVEKLKNNKKFDVFNDKGDI